MCSTALGGLLARKRVSERMPVRELIDGMRCLYAMLQWTLRRIAGLVRARAQHAPQAAAPMSAAHAPALAASSVPPQLHAWASLRAAQQAVCLRAIHRRRRRTSVPAATPVQGVH